MASFRIFTQGDILSFVTQRGGEKKLGECVAWLQDSLTKQLTVKSIQKSTAKFVLLGIPEDVGVRANLGLGGANTAWPVALKAFLNTQENRFLKGADILILGEFLIEEPKDTSVSQLRALVSRIDDLVYPIIEIIVAAGKIPIVIGGGHNNAFPLLKGLSLAKAQKVAAVNIDAHADLRSTEEGRHSGNGFSYAVEQGYLKDYRIFGLHQNYASNAQLLHLDKNKSVKAVYFDDLLLSSQSAAETFKAFSEGLKSPCGLEIDLDSIAGLLSSAGSGTGFDLDEIRRLLLSNTFKFDYLHVCEGASKLNDGRTDASIGKSIAYLVTDFIKSYSSSSS